MPFIYNFSIYKLVMVKCTLQPIYVALLITNKTKIYTATK